MDRQPTRKEITHQRIVETAARAIRRGGFRGVGVADIMREAGLTHGGFYAHFASRDALLAEALERAAHDSGRHLAHAVANSAASGKSGLEALVDGYLSDTHLRSTESGCPVAALVCEMPRQPAAVRKASAERVRGLVALVEDTLPSGTPRATAFGIASQLVGALQLARALGDNAESKALLAAVRLSILEQHDSSHPSR